MDPIRITIDCIALKSYTIYGITNHCNFLLKVIISYLNQYVRLRSVFFVQYAAQALSKLALSHCEH